MAGAPCDGSNAAPSKYFPTMRGARCFPVEDGANLVFEQRALLLDDDDELEPLCEVAHNDRVERPNHADFEEAEAKSGAVIGNAQIAERLQEILPSLAGCDDADPGVRPLADNAIEAVGARIGERGRQFMIVEPLLLRNRVVEGPRA